MKIELNESEWNALLTAVCIVACIALISSCDKTTRSIKDLKVENVTKP